MGVSSKYIYVRFNRSQYLYEVPWAGSVLRSWFKNDNEFSVVVFRLLYYRRRNCIKGFRSKVFTLADMPEMFVVKRHNLIVTARVLQAVFKQPSSACIEALMVEGAKLWLRCQGCGSVTSQMVPSPSIRLWPPQVVSCHKFPLSRSSLFFTYNNVNM